MVVCGRQEFHQNLAHHADLRFYEPLLQRQGVEGFNNAAQILFKFGKFAFRDGFFAFFRPGIVQGVCGARYQLVRPCRVQHAHENVAVDKRLHRAA